MVTWPEPPIADTRARISLPPVGGANAAVVAVVAAVALTTAGLEASVVIVPPNLVTSRAAAPPVAETEEDPAVKGVLAVSVAVLTKVPCVDTESMAVLPVAATGLMLVVVTTE
jgi:hypothetical protein